jgi:ATP synthase protein I
MDELGKTSAYVALFSEIGFVLLVAVLAGVLGGKWVDEQLGTLPIVTLIGFGLGLTGGAVACWRLMARFLAQMDEDEEDEK